MSKQSDPLNRRAIGRQQHGCTSIGFIPIQYATGYPSLIHESAFIHLQDLGVPRSGRIWNKLDGQAFAGNDKFVFIQVYEYLRKNATDPKGPRANLAEYLQRGWIHDIEVDNPSPPYDEGNAGVSKTLEYCYDDYCLAHYAKKLGKLDDYRMFLARAGNYKNLWDASTLLMRGRKPDGSWSTPFYPTEPYYNFMYKESNAWRSTWFVPHDVQGLINLMGGREAFVKRLNQFFTLPYEPKGVARDVTGMIGQYCHGNEPDHHAPFLYNWAGVPWKTQEAVRKIMQLMYGSDKDGLGLAGMDDQGENCSWYVLNAMGFYTVDPARAEYIIGSPIFDDVTVHLDNGKAFVSWLRKTQRKMFISNLQP
jgi:predicted alpha-1,2-mannosidase